MNNTIDMKGFDESMELSRDISNEASTVSDYLKTSEIKHIIDSINDCYIRAYEYSKKKSRFYMLMFTKYYHCGNEELVAAMHEGLINCVDGKFTINEENLK